MITYTNTNIKGHNGHVITIHEDFKPYLDKMNESAVRLGLTIYVMDSIRKSTDVLTGTVVTPAKMSNHFIGFALDTNIQEGKKWHNGESMKKEYDKRIGKVFSFIQECKSFGLRYGGDFHPDRKGKTDPVHFDVAININNPERWHEIYNSLQS